MRKSKKDILNKQIIILRRCYISLVRYLVHIDKFIYVKDIMEEMTIMIDEIYKMINNKNEKIL